MEISVGDALQAIQTGRIIMPDGPLPLSTAVNGARDAKKGTITYKNIKEKNIPTITWGATHTIRAKSGDYISSGFVYFDVDYLAEIEHAKSVIFAHPSVLSIWSSLSGTGVGGIIWVEGPSVGAYLAFAKWLKLYNYTADPAVKDVFSRINVFSYDPNILIKDPKNVEPFTDKVRRLPKASKKPPLHRRGDNQHKSLSLQKDSYSTAHKKALAYAEFIGEYNLQKGRHHTFTTRYAALMNSFGVPREAAINLLKKDYPQFRHTYTLNDIYSRYSEQFFTASLESDLFSSCLQNASYTIQKGQTLMDIGLKREDVVNQYLVAPTGSGKTYFITKLPGKKLIVVPSQALCEELATQYNGKFYNQYNKNVSKNDNLIFVTYASYANISKTLPLEDRDVYLDEAHVLTTDASKSFQLDQLSSAVEAMMQGLHKSLTLVSATPIPTMHPFFANYEYVVVAAGYQKPKSFMQLATDDPAVALKTFLKAKAHNKDNFFIAVLYNNISAGLDGLLASLEGTNVLVFNSQTKEEEHFKALITSPKIEDSVEMFISTSVLKQGNSFYFETPRKAMIVVIGAFAAEEIEQFSARFRNATELETILMRKKDYATKDTYFNAEVMKRKVLDANNSVIADLSQTVKGLDSLSISIDSSIKYFDNRVQIKTTPFGFELDYLAMSNMLFEMQKWATWGNEDLMKKALSDYKWKSLPTKVLTKRFSAAEKEIIKEAKAEAKSTRKEAHEALLNKIRKEGLEANKAECESSRIKPKESKVRHKLNRIFKYEKDEEKCFKIYLQYCGSETKWRDLFARVGIARILTDSVVKEMPDYKVLSAIKNEFSVGEVVPISEIHSRILPLTEPLPKSIVLSEKKAKILFDLMYESESKPVRDPVTGESPRCRVILGLHDIPFKINTDEYRKRTGAGAYAEFYNKEKYHKLFSHILNSR